MVPDGRPSSNTAFRRVARIGFQGEFMNLTRGNGPDEPRFDEYAPVKDGSLAERRNGCWFRDNGEAVAYARGSCRTVAVCSSARATSCTKE